MTVRVKICGITRAEDALCAADAGADAVGLVFFSGSKRFVTVEQAQAVVRALPPMVSSVGLFVNADADVVAAILRQVPLDILQFHGDEPPEFCRQFDRLYWKAVRVRSRADIEAAAEHYHDARALLLDAYAPDQYGGTGQAFDWTMLPETVSMPWILAGGLTADNVRDAVRQSGAVAVDVSGGVEVAAGIKDSSKIQAFIRAAKGG